MKSTELSIKCSFRITSEQDERLKQICEETGRDRSTYLRMLIEDKPFVPLTTTEERIQRAALITEINRIGVNINQIVKNVNSFFYSREEKMELFQMLEKIYALLDGKL